MFQKLLFGSFKDSLFSKKVYPNTLGSQCDKPSILSRVLLKFFDQAFLRFDYFTHGFEWFKSFLWILRLVNIWHSSYQSPESFTGWSSRKKISLIIGETIQLIEEALLYRWDWSSAIRLKILNFLFRCARVSIGWTLSMHTWIDLFMDRIRLILTYFCRAGNHILLVLFAVRRCLFVDLSLRLSLITRDSQSIRIRVN